MLDSEKINCPVCKECGDEGFYKLDGEVLCENCAAERIDRILDNLSIEETAETLGIELIEISEEELN